MTAPINLQAVQTVYALELQKPIIFLNIDQNFLTDLSFDFSVQSIQAIDDWLVTTPNITQDQLKLIAFYVAEFFARVGYYSCKWQQNEDDSISSIFVHKRQTNLCKIIYFFEHLEETFKDKEKGLIQFLSQEIGEDLIQAVDAKQTFPRIIEHNTDHLDQYNRLSEQEKYAFSTPLIEGLEDYFNDIPLLLSKGHILKAKILRVHQTSLDVIYDFNDLLSDEDLTFIQHYLLHLIHHKPQELSEDEQAWQIFLKEKLSNFYDHVPLEGIVGYPAFCSKIHLNPEFFIHQTLPENQLIQVLVDPEISDYMMVMPDALMNDRACDI